MIRHAAARHASPRSRILTLALPVGLGVIALGALLSLAGVAQISPVVPPVPAAAARLPAIDVAATPAADPCMDAAVRSALEAQDDAATIAAFGGGEQFRAAVAAGNAPCVRLDDPSRAWVVVNKQRPLGSSYAPTSLGDSDVRPLSGSVDLRPEVAQAMSRLGAALKKAGAGELGINNGYRSFALQQRTYSGHVADRGQAEADEVSARPGFSEHQTGLALDVVSCSSGCGSIHAFGGTRESDWVVEHAWEYGFIVRYESGRTGVTGYAPEPWHLRYIGPELAAAYRAGGFTTLEEFFGLAAAPDYAP